MILRSKIPIASKAGVSLLETLVMLAILSMIMAATANRIIRPSASLQVHRKSAQILRETAKVRHQAISENRIIYLDFTDQSCTPETGQFTFFPDGTAIGQDLCVVVEESKIVLLLNAFTGRLEQVPK